MTVHMPMLMNTWHREMQQQNLLHYLFWAWDYILNRTYLQCNINNAKEHTQYNDNPQYDLVYIEETNSDEWEKAYENGYERLNAVETDTRNHISDFLEDYGSYLFKQSECV